MSNITYTSAEIVGTIVSDGNSPVQSSGFCWSIKQALTLSDNHVLGASDASGFKAGMNNLEEGTDYYVRAYATYRVGTGYGPEKKFTTGLSCQTMVVRHPGYQVWAGNTPYFQFANQYDYFYSIDKYDYTLIGEANTTQTFSTGQTQ